MNASPKSTPPPPERSSSEFTPIPLSRRPEWPAALLLVFFGVFLALVLCEIAARLFWNQLAAKPIWTDRPRFYYAPMGSAFGSDYSYAHEKPPATFRIGVVGDSFTFPPFMQFDDAFPKRLERMLNMNAPLIGDAGLKEKTSAAENKTPAPFIHAEVLNFGRWGASTRDEVSTVQKALHFQSDLVILEITLNDPEIQPYAPKNMAPGANYTFGALEISREKTPLYYYWRTLGLIASRLHNSRTYESYLRYHRSLFEDERYWKPFTQRLRMMKVLARRAHRPFVAIVFPFIHVPLNENYPFRDAHEKIDNFLASKKIPYLDLLTAFQNIPSDRLIVAPGRDNHPNEIAHRIVAESLYDWLVEKKLIPDSLVIAERFAHRGGTHAAVE